MKSHYEMDVFKPTPTPTRNYDRYEFEKVWGNEGIDIDFFIYMKDQQMRVKQMTLIIGKLTSYLEVLIQNRVDGLIEKFNSSLKTTSVKEIMQADVYIATRIQIYKSMVAFRCIEHHMENHCPPIFAELKNIIRAHFVNIFTAYANKHKKDFLHELDRRWAKVYPGTLVEISKLFQNTFKECGITEELKNNFEERIKKIRNTSDRSQIFNLVLDALNTMFDSSVPLLQSEIVSPPEHILAMTAIRLRDDHRMAQRPPAPSKRYEAPPRRVRTPSSEDELSFSVSRASPAKPIRPATSHVDHFGLFATTSLIAAAFQPRRDDELGVYGGRGINYGGGD